MTVRRFEVGDLAGRDGALDVDVHVVCSSGTYVRALARDLGAGLGVGGHLTMLRRTRVGPYGLDVAHTLEELPTTSSCSRSPTPPGPPSRPATSTPRPRPWCRTAARCPATGVPGPVAVFGPDGGFLALVEDRGETTRAVAVFV